MRNDNTADCEWIAGWECEKLGNYSEAMEHYQMAARHGSALARERYTLLNRAGDCIYEDPEDMDTEWFRYDTVRGNVQYAGFFGKPYHIRNRVIFRHLFSTYFSDRTSASIAIIGGGNGWELDEIYDLTDEVFTDLSVQCTIIDPVEWPLRHTGVHQSLGHSVKHIHRRIGQMYGGVDPADLSSYDLVYFARCVNYCDAKFMDLEWLRDRTTLLSRNTVVAFDQVDQPSSKVNSYNYQQRFEQIFENPARKTYPNSPLYNESLYVMEA